MFNKYNFIRELENEVIDYIESKEFTEIEQVTEYIDQSIDNACIYYSDCFDIIKELGFTDWSESNDYIENPTNVSQLAYIALQELVYEEFDFEQAQDLIDEIEKREGEQV